MSESENPDEEVKGDNDDDDEDDVQEDKLAWKGSAVMLCGAMREACEKRGNILLSTIQIRSGEM